MSLLLRLTMTLALLFLAVFAFVGLAAVGITADTVERGLEARIDSTLRTVSANPQFFVIEVALREKSEGHLSQVADISGFQIVVAAPDRRSVVASTVDRALAIQLLSAAPDADRFPVALGGVSYRAARGIVRGRPVYLLAPAAPIEAAKREAQRRSLVVAGIGLAVTVVLGLLLAGTVIRPIRRLARAVSEIREGEERDDLPRGGGREVEELRLAFEKMLTRLIRYREEMVSREKMATLGQFSAAVAHELRNPLSSMRMTLDLLREEVGPEARDDIDFLRAEASRLDHSVEELLFYAGRPRYEMGPADVSAVVSDAVKMVRPLADHLEVSLSVPTPDGPFPIRGDANRLRQALVNLLLNAVQACKSGQSVSVAVTRPLDTVSVTVSDEGPGVPADLEERLFEPFVTGRAGGTGLGLSVTAAIARAHHGEVRYEREDGQTRFSLLLPARRR